MQDDYYRYDMSYVMVPQKQETLPLFPPRTAISRPRSNTTEICEDEDDDSECFESPMLSVASVSDSSMFWASKFTKLTFTLLRS